VQPTLDNSNDAGSEHSERAVGFALFSIVLQPGDLVPDFLQGTVAEFVAFLPRLIGAIVILVIGWIVGRIVAGLVRRVVDATGIDRLVLDTPLWNALGDTQTGVSEPLGTIAAWFVYALAILAAADALDIPLLSEWIARALAYLPAFVAGLLIIVLGFVVADFVGDVIERTRETTETPYTSWFATGVRMFLYFVVVTIGLDTMGVDTEILYIFATALAWGLAAAVALGVGLGVAIALGWGGHGYVSENIGRWTSGARNRAPSASDDGESSGQGQS
jgi:hypothetical protein